MWNTCVFSKNPLTASEPGPFSRGRDGRAWRIIAERGQWRWEIVTEVTMSDTVLVTGGGGFIGTWVLRELISRGLSPVVIDIQKNSERWKRILGSDADKVRFVAGTLLDRPLLSRVVDENRVFGRHEKRREQLRRERALGKHVRVAFRLRFFGR